MNKVQLFSLAFASMLIACGNQPTETSETAQKEQTPVEQPATNKTEAPKQNEDLSKMLVGTWKMVKISNREMTEQEKNTLIEFHADGTAKNNLIKDSGTWRIEQKDGKIILHTNYKSEEQFELKNFSAQQMTMLYNSLEIDLVKQ